MSSVYKRIPIRNFDIQHRAFPRSASLPDSQALPDINSGSQFIALYADSSQVKPNVPDSQFGDFRMSQSISESIAS